MKRTLMPSFSVPVFAQGGGGGSSGFGGGSIPAPKGWLGTVAPSGFPTGGLDYITGNVAPFIVNAAVLLVIFLSLVFLLIGAIMWIASSGNKESLAKAKATVTFALVGLILGVASFIFLNIVGQLLGVKFFG